MGRFQVAYLSIHRASLAELSPNENQRLRQHSTTVAVVELSSRRGGFEIEAATTPYCSPSPRPYPHTPRSPSAGISPTSAPCPALSRSRSPHSRARPA